MNTTEKKVSHTPGPWELLYPKSFCYSIHGKDRPAIATINGNYPDFEQCEENEAEHLANAKLIAAAPDLLEACRKAFEQICNHEDGHKLQFQRVEDLLENAIKKATA